MPVKNLLQEMTVSLPGRFDRTKQANITLILTIIFLLIILNLKPAFSNTEPPSLSYKDEKGREVKLNITYLKVDVKVVGKLAVTTMDITFSNSTNRVLEGELNFPLAEGQSVSRFALEINGKLREGVVVEKEKGRVVFESVVRKRIDPALLEMTRGNSFKSRIYPIPANGTKRVVLAYEETLQENADGMVYRLPLAFTEPIDTFRLAATVFGDCNILKSKASMLDYKKFMKTGNAYVTALEYKNYKADKQFEFMMASPENRGDAMTETIDGKTYFSIDIFPNLKTSKPALPKSITIFWDVSSSHASSDLKKELRLLENYLKKVQPAKLTVVTYANEIIDSKVFNPLQDNYNEIKDYFEKCDYDGATRLSAIDPAQYPADQYLLFTDGISNFGKSELKPFGKPLYIINSNQNAEHDILRYYAQESGGTYINLLATEPDDALNLLLNGLPSFISAEVISGDTREVYPSISIPVKGSFLLTGQLLTNTAKIKLNFGYGSKITKSVTVELDEDKNKTETGLLGRIWAQKKLAELNMQYEKNKDAITALGKEYSIVTRNTSLIVLDRVEDYARYHITPPEELKNDYDRLTAQFIEDNMRDSIEHFNNVVQMFNREKDWWSNEFDLGETYMRMHPDYHSYKTFIQANTYNSVIAGSRQLSKEDSGILVGTIKDQNGNSIWGSIAKTSNSLRGSIVKNKDGYYSIINLPPGVHTIYSTYFGYDTLKTQVNISANGVTKQDLVLHKRTNFISGINPSFDSDETSEIIIYDYDENIRVGALPDQSNPLLPAEGSYGDLSDDEESADNSEECEVDEYASTDTTHYREFATIDVMSRASVDASWENANDSLLAPDLNLHETLGTVNGKPRPWAEGGAAVDLDGSAQSSGRSSAYTFTTAVREEKVITGGPTVEYTGAPDGGSLSINGNVNDINLGNSAQRESMLLMDYNSKMPYLKAIGGASLDSMYKIYIGERKAYGENPGFYLDASQLMLDRGDTLHAVRALSNIAELQLENQELMRILGHRLQQIGCYDLAESTFRYILDIRGEEPQSYRDLALVLADAGKYAEAAETLYWVAMSRWNSRFPEVELIALNELNRLVALHTDKVDVDKFAPELIKKMPVDIRVVMNWDTDDCDIDLMILEPTKEICYYGNQLTKYGGKLTNDFTGGYGPEEYMLKRVIPGKYVIYVKYYGSRSQKILGETTVQLEIYTRYSTGEEVKKVSTVRLKEVDDEQKIAELEF